MYTLQLNTSLGVSCPYDVEARARLIFLAMSAFPSSRACCLQREGTDEHAGPHVGPCPLLKGQEVEGHPVANSPGELKVRGRLSN